MLLLSAIMFVQVEMAEMVSLVSRERMVTWVKLASLDSPAGKEIWLLVSMDQMANLEDQVLMDAQVSKALRRLYMLIRVDGRQLMKKFSRNLNKE